MALVYTRDANYAVSSVGDLTRVIGTVAFDSSYPTGGEVVTPSALGLIHVVDVACQTSGGYNFEYIKSTGKLMAYVSSTGAEAAGSADLSALTTVNFQAIGKGQ